MPQVTQHVLHCALTQRHPQLERQAGRVHLLVTFAVEDLTPRHVLLGLAADALQADGGEEPRPGGGVVVGDVRLPLSLQVPPVALCLLLNISLIRFLMEWRYFKMTNWTKNGKLCTSRT